MKTTRAEKGGLAIILFASFLLWISIVVRSPSPTPSAASSPKQKKAEIFKKASPAEYVATAERLLQEHPPNDSRVLVVLMHLRAIPPTAPEHPEAQRLLKEAERRFERIRRETLARQQGAGSSSPTFHSSLSVQQSTTPNSARPPVITGKDSPATRVTYDVEKEEIYDAPVKTQIVQHIVVSGVPTEAELRSEILKRYRSAKARRGFRYHNPATNIYLYAYRTKEQARAGQGLWIGMLAMGPSDEAAPRVVINEGRLAALSQEPEDRFSLSEQKRKKIFREIVVAEDRAWREAEARVLNPQGMKQIMKLGGLQSKLEEKYRAGIRRKYGLTKSQLLNIAVEAHRKGWVLPPLK